MRERPSSRLLLVNAEGRVLLFRFEHSTGPSAGSTFWATPGGGLNRGESYEEAACRELMEETGVQIDHPGPQIARRLVEFRTPSEGWITADERFFLVRCNLENVSRERWTELERAVLAEHRWWSSDDLRATTAQIWPENLAKILTTAGVWEAPAMK